VWSGFNIRSQSPKQNSSPASHQIGQGLQKNYRRLLANLNGRGVRRRGKLRCGGIIGGRLYWKLYDRNCRYAHGDASIGVHFWRLVGGLYDRQCYSMHDSDEQQRARWRDFQQLKISISPSAADPETDAHLGLGSSASGGQRRGWAARIRTLRSKTRGRASDCPPTLRACPEKVKPFPVAAHPWAALTESSSLYHIGANRGAATISPRISSTRRVPPSQRTSVAFRPVRTLSRSSVWSMAEYATEFLAISIRVLSGRSLIA
jgi:hypothetical protein